jgi:hypothetical protein
MAYHDEEEEQEEQFEKDDTLDDDKKVFVSRLPNKWSEEQLATHFQACFGTVISATIKWDTKNECSLGYGYVVFESEASKNMAVNQGSIHAKKKTIMIRAVEREENALGRGRDQGICFLWQRFACVKGCECKFSHDGPGACVQVSAFGEGKLKKCMSFKSKGKCSKGDGCPFLHALKPVKAAHTKIVATDDLVEEDIEVKTNKEERIKHCHMFQKSGKCRKGDSCKFSHMITTGISRNDDNIAEETKKRKRIDGDELVNRMKQAFA